jgi:hypothetical protein
MKMKQYIARFVGKNKFTRCETTIECDGINDTHANARAWIKFMRSQLYRNDPDIWELVVLRDANWKG